FTQDLTQDLTQNLIQDLTQNLVKKLCNAKESNELVKFVFEIKLDKDLINTIALT
ncbi:32567_t:CDS:2, partial [Racocetra persica]